MWAIEKGVLEGDSLINEADMGRITANQADKGMMKSEEHINFGTEFTG